MAIGSLIIGIISIMIGFITGIPAVICGHLALRRIKSNEQRFKGEGLAIAGLALGYTGTVLGTIVVIVKLFP